MQLKLEEKRRNLVASVEDRLLMREQSRATLVRMAIERSWKECAANEAAALAKASEKPAKILAEAALTACQEWERLLQLALEKGANPYLNEHRSDADMVTLAQLESREAALARILMWRSGLPASPDGAAGPRPMDAARRANLPRPNRAKANQVPTGSAETSPTAASGEASSDADEEQVIIVTARRGGGCRVRLADRTLTDRELAANAKIWAASGTPLRVIRPAGADYGCMARIAWRLGEHGVRLFHFVDSPSAK